MLAMYLAMLWFKAAQSGMGLRWQDPKKALNPTEKAWPFQQLLDFKRQDVVPKQIEAKSDLKIEANNHCSAFSLSDLHKYSYHFLPLWSW